MFWSEHDRIVRLAAAAARLLDGDLEGALALGDRHREELALLAGDEQAVDGQIVDPVADVAAQPGLVDGESPGVNGVAAAAQMPRMCWREYALASLLL